MSREEILRLVKLRRDLLNKAEPGMMREEHPELPFPGSIADQYLERYEKALSILEMPKQPRPKAPAGMLEGFVGDDRAYSSAEIESMIDAAENFKEKNTYFASKADISLFQAMRLGKKSLSEKNKELFDFVISDLSLPPPDSDEFKFIHFYILYPNLASPNVNNKLTMEEIADNFTRYLARSAEEAKLPGLMRSFFEGKEEKFKEIQEQRRMQRATEELSVSQYQNKMQAVLAALRNIKAYVNTLPSGSKYITLGELRNQNREENPFYREFVVLSTHLPEKFSDAFEGPDETEITMKVLNDLLGEIRAIADDPSFEMQESAQRLKVNLLSLEKLISANYAGKVSIKNLLEDKHISNFITAIEKGLKSVFPGKGKDGKEYGDLEKAFGRVITTEKINKIQSELSDKIKSFMGDRAFGRISEERLELTRYNPPPSRIQYALDLAKNLAENYEREGRALTTDQMLSDEPGTAPILRFLLVRDPYTGEMDITKSLVGPDKEVTVEILEELEEDIVFQEEADKYKYNVGGVTPIQTAELLQDLADLYSENARTKMTPDEIKQRDQELYLKLKHVIDQYPDGLSLKDIALKRKALIDDGSTVLKTMLGRNLQTIEAYQGVLEILKDKDRTKQFTIKDLKELYPEYYKALAPIFKRRDIISALPMSRGLGQPPTPDAREVLAKLPDDTVLSTDLIRKLYLKDARNLAFKKDFLDVFDDAKLAIAKFRNENEGRPPQVIEFMREYESIAPAIKGLFSGLENEDFITERMLDDYKENLLTGTKRPALKQNWDTVLVKPGRDIKETGDFNRFWRPFADNIVGSGVFGVKAKNDALDHLENFVLMQQRKGDVPTLDEYERLYSFDRMVDGSDPSEEGISAEEAKRREEAVNFQILRGMLDNFGNNAKKVSLDDVKSYIRILEDNFDRMLDALDFLADEAEAFEEDNDTMTSEYFIQKFPEEAALISFYLGKHDEINSSDVRKTFDDLEKKGPSSISKEFPHLITLEDFLKKRERDGKGSSIGLGRLQREKEDLYKALKDYLKSNYGPGRGKAITLSDVKAMRNRARVAPLLQASDWIKRTLQLRDAGTERTDNDRTVDTRISAADLAVLQEAAKVAHQTGFLTPEQVNKTFLSELSADPTSLQRQIDHLENEMLMNKGPATVEDLVDTDRPELRPLFKYMASRGLNRNSMVTEDLITDLLNNVNDYMIGQSQKRRSRYLNNKTFGSSLYRSIEELRNKYKVGRGAFADEASQDYLKRFKERAEQARKAYLVGLAKDMSNRKLLSEELSRMEAELLSELNIARKDAIADAQLQRNEEIRVARNEADDLFRKERKEDGTVMFVSYIPREKFENSELYPLLEGLYYDNTGESIDEYLGDGPTVRGVRSVGSEEIYGLIKKLRKVNYKKLSQEVTNDLMKNPEFQKKYDEINEIRNLAGKTAMELREMTAREGERASKSSLLGKDEEEEEFESVEELVEREGEEEIIEER